MESHLVPVRRKDPARQPVGYVRRVRGCRATGAQVSARVHGSGIVDAGSDVEGLSTRGTVRGLGFCGWIVHQCGLNEKEKMVVVGGWRCGP